MAKKRESGESPSSNQKRGGSDTIRELGLKSTLVPVTPEEHQVIRTAAGIRGVPVNQFMREAATDRARRDIENFKAGGTVQPAAEVEAEGKPATKPPGVKGPGRKAKKGD